MYRNENLSFLLTYRDRHIDSDPQQIVPNVDSNVQLFVYNAAQYSKRNAELRGQI